MRMRFEIALIYLLLLGSSFFLGQDKSSTPAIRGPSSTHYDCSLALLEIVDQSSKGSSRQQILKKIDVLRRRQMANIEQEDRLWLMGKAKALKEEVQKRQDYLAFLLEKARNQQQQLLEKEIQELEELQSSHIPLNVIDDTISRLSSSSNLSTEQKTWLVGKLKELADGKRTAEVQKVNRQLPINSQHANSFYPHHKLPESLKAKYPHSVHFNNKGFPNFNAYSKHTVEIEVTGVGHVDFARANQEIGLKNTPANFTWHHHQDGRTLQLIPRDLHDAVKHTGGVAVVTSKIKRIRGALPQGAEYAGKYFPSENLPQKLRNKYPDGIRYKKNGHPDLAPYARAIVEIESTGKRRLDMALAKEAAELEQIPSSHTWKMREDGSTMELLPRELLKAIPYTDIY